MKTISCGGIIIYDKKILIGRPNWKTTQWNIPKGIMEDTDISYYHTAKREIFEETNIDIETNCFNIEDIGLHKYTKDKDLYLYLIQLQTSPVICCNSFYEYNNQKLPEMVDFKWMNLNEYTNMFSITLQNVFTSNLKKIYDFLNKT